MVNKKPNLRIGWIFDRIQNEMQMKKLMLFSVISLGYAVSAYGATQWWTRPTICRVSPNDCYTSMGVGFDSERWDSTGNCYGMKLICPDALSNGADGAMPIGRADIAAGRGINPDFDTSILVKNERCYGARKTASNGTQVAVDGKYVIVWCRGVLDNFDASVENGEITYGEQPTCSDLANNGYIGVLDGKCYGKYYDTAKYFIDCGTSRLMPERIIILNGAEMSSVPGTEPVDATSADELFDRMYSVSQSQHKKYYKE